MNQKRPRVLVGCPTFEGMRYCLDQYLKAVQDLTYGNFELVLVDNSKTNSYHDLLKSKGIRVLRLPKVGEDKMQNVVDSRNILREIVLNENFDYFLSLEQDVIPPTNVIETLLDFQKEIVSGVYFGAFVHEGKLGIKPLLYTWLTQKEFDHILNNPEIYSETIEKINENNIKSPDQLRRQLTREEVAEIRLIEVKQTALGCTLIKRDILEKFPFKKSSGNLGTDDIQFCEDARKAGNKVYAFTGIICKHLKQNNKINNFD